MTDTQDDKKLKKSTVLSALSQLAMGKLEDQITQTNEANSDVDLTRKPNIKFIPVDLIDENPNQPRKDFNSEKIHDLSQSIDVIGQMQPIVIRRMGLRYQLIAGERRLMATKILGRKEIEAIIKEEVDEGDSALMALAENIDREGLSDYEVAIAMNNVQNRFENKKALSVYFRKTRTDYYRYEAFLSLPDWIIDRLNATPRIINRTNALELKKLIGGPSYKEETYKGAIIKALNLVEANKITQTTLIAQIKLLLKENQQKEETSREVIEQKYSVKGKSIGKLVFNDDGLALKIKADILTGDDIDQIHKIISNRIAS